MRRFFKRIGILLIAGMVCFVIFGWWMHEELPKGKEGAAADALAHKMLAALNHSAYEKTRFLEWSFQNGTNNYIWDKQTGQVKINWDEITVNLELTDLDKSEVLRKGRPIGSEEKQKLIEKALKNFNNDSFWLVAPYKVFDKGTQRAIVGLEDGTEGLLVTYALGGTTPGDSYLWILDEKGLPKAYKMWVQIIPVGGLEASWEDWFISQSGAHLPKSHKLGPFTLKMGDVKAYTEER